MSELFKIVIKPIKPKIKETDPIKIEALKEKRRLQREVRKNKPKQDGMEAIPKQKPEKKNKEELENINKTLKNLVGFSIDEINEKLKASKITTPQLGLPEPLENFEIKEIKQTKKKGKKKM